MRHSRSRSTQHQRCTRASSTCERALTLGQHLTKDALTQAAMRFRLLGQTKLVTCTLHQRCITVFSTCRPNGKSQQFSPFDFSDFVSKSVRTIRQSEFHHSEETHPRLTCLVCNEAFEDDKERTASTMCDSPNSANHSWPIAGPSISSLYPTKSLPQRQSPRKHSTPVLPELLYGCS